MRVCFWFWVGFRGSQKTALSLWLLQSPPKRRLRRPRRVPHAPCPQRQCQRRAQGERLEFRPRWTEQGAKKIVYLIYCYVWYVMKCLYMYMHCCMRYIMMFVYIYVLLYIYIYLVYMVYTLHMSSGFLVVSGLYITCMPTRRPTQTYAACEGCLRERKSPSRCLRGCLRGQMLSSSVEVPCGSSSWKIATFQWQLRL